MKNLLLVNIMLLAVVPALSANFTETSDLFYGTYSEDYVMRWQFQKLCQHVFDPRTDPFMWPTKPGGSYVQSCRSKARRSGVCAGCASIL